MSKGLTPGAVLPDFTLPDDTGTIRRLSELQGDNLMVLMLGRGEHCPRSASTSAKWSCSISGAPLPLRNW